MSSLLVSTNIEAITVAAQMGQASLTLGDLASELSSGKRIEVSSDGPAAFDIALELALENSGQNTAMSNVNQGMSVLQIAGGAVQQIQGILTSLYQLALSSSNTATMTPSTYSSNDAAYQSSLQEISQIANTTQFGQLLLLTGTYVNEMFQVGPYVQQTVMLTIPAATPAALGLGGSSVGTAASASAALLAVIGAMGGLSTIGDAVGATQQELLGLLQNLVVAEQNGTASQAMLVDANMADTIARYAVAQILFNASTAMLAQAQLNPRDVLSLLALGHGAAFITAHASSSSDSGSSAVGGSVGGGGSIQGGGVDTVRPPTSTDRYAASVSSGAGGSGHLVSG